MQYCIFMVMAVIIITIIHCKCITTDINVYTTVLLLVSIDGDSEDNKVRIIKIIKKIITDTRPETTRKIKG